MRRAIWVVFSCFLCGSAMVGCGESNPRFEQKIDMDFAANIKTDLQAIAKSGRLGSGFGLLKSNVTALKAKDPTKAEAIEKGLEELTKLQGEAKVKAKAEELLKLL